MNGRKIHFLNEINHLGASWVCIIIQRENTCNTEMSKKMIFNRVIVENYKNIGIRNSSNIMK